MRVHAGGQVRAEDTISDAMPETELDRLADEHEAIARSALAEGMVVSLEALNLDGSLFGYTILAPIPRDPGFRVVAVYEAP